ncbi:MAG TPA: hypothetical protein VNI57_13435, partial [Candidatus Saccharimonadales bacterium]|nr:hypothetical protein [Candidatus Saccharimonadales bacterium]
MTRRTGLLTAALLLAVLCAPAAAMASITIHVDATDAPRKIFHANLTIPVKPGPLTLLYPEWIPGEHGPTGPVVDLAGLKFTAGDTDLAWKRDSENMYAFHLEIPKGATSLDVFLDYLSPATPSGFSEGASASSQLAVVSWNQLLLYPQGEKTEDLTYEPDLRIPEGWKYGTALETVKDEDGTISFSPVPLNMLIDSPVLTGAHFRVYKLGADEGREHEVDVAAESEAALAMTPQWQEAVKHLIGETGALFGAYHYRHYNFLLTLSDEVAHFGLEHHESSDDRVHERTFLDDAPRLLHDGLLTHEMVHSWNGKYRRPAGLMPGHYDEPMHGDMLWVYEGLTDYLGHILSARSGFQTAEQFMDRLALATAELDRRSGRLWRPLEDTAVSAQILYGAPHAWGAWRRGVDYYDEGDLIWLEADTIIRRESKGAKSLDDFCRSFYGGRSGPPEVKPYTFDDVMSALNDVVPYNWKGFFTERLKKKGLDAPTGGLKSSGWRLVFDNVRSERLKAEEKVNKEVDVRFSIGLMLDEKTGMIDDALPGLPAYKAGIGPGMTVIAVNGRKFSDDVIREAIAAAKGGSDPIELLVENGEYFKTYAVDYHDGEKYPHLERIPGTVDLLSDIVRPHAVADKKP